MPLEFFRTLLGQFLHFMRIWHMPSLLHSRPGHHAIIPRLDRGKFVNIKASPECTGNPAPGCNISDGTLIADYVSRGGIFELFVEDAVETSGFVDVAVYTVFD